MAHDSVDKAQTSSFLYQILEDVYNASDTFRPEIEQYHTANKSTRSQSFGSISTKKSSQFSIQGALAPTALKNYHIPSAPLSARGPTQHLSHPLYPCKPKTKSKSKKRPSSAHPRPIRSRAFYKNTRQIEKRCSANQQKRCRPKSAPIRKSQSTSTLLSNGSKRTVNNNKYRSRPKSSKSPRSYALSKMGPHSISTPRHYQSVTNLVFTPSTVPKTFEILKMNQHLRSQHKPKVISFTGSYLTNSGSTEEVPMTSNTTNNVIPDALSRSKWIQNYVKDRKQGLYSLDEFAQLKLMDLERMSRRKRDHSAKSISKITESSTISTSNDSTPPMTAGEEFDAVIPDIKEDDTTSPRRTTSPPMKPDLSMSTNQNQKVNNNSINSVNLPPTAAPPHIHLKNQVTDHSLRIAMYLDLLQMISESVPKHQDLLKFLHSELGKYVFDDQSTQQNKGGTLTKTGSGSDHHQNKENKENDEPIKFSSLCRRSTYLDSFYHYKQKYECLQQQIAEEKRQKEWEQHRRRQEETLKLLMDRRTDHLKRYFKEWRLIKNLRKFKYSNIERRKRTQWTQWRNAYQQSRLWNFECTIDGLRNELDRSEMYREIYCAQNDALTQQIKQYKEALVTCVDAVKRNEFCEVCMSSWHDECCGYIKGQSLRHTFLSDLFS